MYSIEQIAKSVSRNSILDQDWPDEAVYCVEFRITSPFTTVAMEERMFFRNGFDLSVWYQSLVGTTLRTRLELDFGLEIVALYMWSLLPREIDQGDWEAHFLCVPQQ